jgi:hypothetical protein
VPRVRSSRLRADAGLPVLRTADRPAAG